MEEVEGDLDEEEGECDGRVGGGEVEKIGMEGEGVVE